MLAAGFRIVVGNDGPGVRFFWHEPVTKSFQKSPVKITGIGILAYDLVGFFTRYLEIIMPDIAITVVHMERTVDHLQRLIKRIYSGRKCRILRNLHPDIV